MEPTKNETSLYKILFGAFLIFAGVGVYRMWINYPIPKDFWGSLFMNFGVVYPTVGIVAAVYGAYLILTSSVPTTRKGVKEYVGDNSMVLVFLVWTLSIFILPKFVSMETTLIITVIGGAVLVIWLATKKDKK